MRLLTLRTDAANPRFMPCDARQTERVESWAISPSVIDAGIRNSARFARPPAPHAETAAMLPAADAQVAAVAAALAATTSPDVRARLKELATLVQRLCDANHTPSRANRPNQIGRARDHARLQKSDDSRATTAPSLP